VSQVSEHSEVSLAATKSEATAEVEGFECSEGKGRACKVCKPASKRTSDDQCQECNHGHKLTKDFECVPYHCTLGAKTGCAECRPTHEATDDE